MDDLKKSKPWFFIHPVGWWEEGTWLNFRPSHWKGWLATAAFMLTVGLLLLAGNAAGWMHDFVYGLLVVLAVIAISWSFRRFVVESHAEYSDARRPRRGSDLRKKLP